MNGTEKQINYANSILDKIIFSLREKDSYMVDYDKLRIKNEKKLSASEISEAKYNERIFSYVEKEELQKIELVTRESIISDLENIRVHGNAWEIISNLSNCNIYGWIINRNDNTKKNTAFVNFVNKIK